MKGFIIIWLFCVSVIANAQPINRTFEQLNGALHLLGKATYSRFQQEPFNDWFYKSYADYEADEGTLQQLNLPDSITIFLGTWCGDSKREVPRFFKLLHTVDFDTAKVGIICLNTGFQNYKQAPDREEAGMSIHRVPTFIFHDAEKQEIGRIVEEPVVSLEKDLRAIVSGDPYNTYFPVANDLIRKFEKFTVKDLHKEKSSLVETYRDISVSEYELNTYGYVLWTSFNLMKAELVFELNQQLYPAAIRPISTLARFKASIGKQKEAWKYLKMGIKEHPDDQSLAKIATDWEDSGL